MPAPTTVSVAADIVQTAEGVAVKATPRFEDAVAPSGTTHRMDPDVSYDAGSTVAVYDSYESSSPWVGLVGTSVGAPQWAALIAIADQGRAQFGLPSRHRERLLQSLSI